jgi:hypothetical protein
VGINESEAEVLLRSRHRSCQNPRMEREADTPKEQLENTAEGWRTTIDEEAEKSAEEVARGADRAAEQPDFGQEGN